MPFIGGSRKVDARTHFGICQPRGRLPWRHVTCLGYQWAWEWCTVAASTAAASKSRPPLPLTDSPETPYFPWLPWLHYNEICNMRTDDTSGPENKTCMWFGKVC